MRELAFALCMLLSACAADKGNIRVGAVSEPKYVEKTAQTMADEGLGTYTTLTRKGPWNPDKLRKTAEVCRANGMTMSMGAVMDRRNMEIQPVYLDSLSEIVSVLHEYSDVVESTKLSGEFTGVHFAWPYSSVATAKDVMPAFSTYSQAQDWFMQRVQGEMTVLDSIGMLRPYVTVEPNPGAFSLLLRSGVDQVDVEMIFGEDTELLYASALGAHKAFGKKAYGVDHAMVWYGGEQHDKMWFDRHRMGYYHAYLRGANPIYMEHGLMKYSAYGNKYPTDHPYVVRFREQLGEFAAWCRRNPRPEGYPRAAVAFMQGRLDGYMGTWQTHLWGQRLNDDFRIGDDERAWKIVGQCYEKENWNSRDRNGEVSYSGNPPLGTLDVVPYDTPDDILSQYKVVVLLGFNSMDDELYQKLIRYVSSGGVLLMAARHMDSRERPLDAFKPYNEGDWTALTGLKALDGRRRMKYGLKFTANPSCGWKLHQYGTKCDPWWTDGGFEMPLFENHGADTLAVGASAFWEDKYDTDECLLFEHKIGEGTVVFCPSVSSVGASELYPLYQYLVRRAFESVDVYPKVECTETVRWACYDDGSVILLNTEDNLRQEVVLHRSPDSSRRIRLKPGEIKIIR